MAPPKPPLDLGRNLRNELHAVQPTGRRRESISMSWASSIPMAPFLK